MGPSGSSPFAEPIQHFDFKKKLVVVKGIRLQASQHRFPTLLVFILGMLYRYLKTHVSDA